MSRTFVVPLGQNTRKMKHLIFTLVLIISVMVCVAGKSSDPPIEYIKKESVGGSLDFMKILEQEGKAQKLIPYKGSVYSSNDYAIIRWAEEVNTLGIKSFKEATELWQFIYQRELFEDEIKIFKKGFKMKS